MTVDLNNLSVGTVVPGTKWVVCGKLGEGGMGLVLEVVKEPGIRGAMKVIRPDISGRRNFIERFLNEVRLLASLEHRNIVRVFDFDRIDDQMPFVVMELLAGGTLRQAMRAHGRALPAPMAYEIMRQSCDGLDRAHSATPSIIHRDFKPENVFLHSPAGDQPVVKVMDFGLAILADGERDRGLFGTLRYMAPEQLRGERATVRSDIYQAALVLYEMLTGRMPWDFDVVRVEDAHLSIAPEPPSRFAPWIPAQVDAHIVSALAKDPADRPHDAFAFMAKLYELQWAEGKSNPIDVATTAPDLATLADVFRDADVWGDASSTATYRGVTRPPLEGRSLEIAPEGLVPGETERMPAPVFSPETMARAVLGVTRVPSGVDRMASTNERTPSTERVPKHDTQPLTPLPSARPGHSAPGGPPSMDSAPGAIEVGRPASDAGVAHSVNRNSMPAGRLRLLLRRRILEVSVFVGTIAVAGPAAILLQRSGSGNPASAPAAPSAATSTVAPEGAMSLASLPTATEAAPSATPPGLRAPARPASATAPLAKEPPLRATASGSKVHPTASASAGALPPSAKPQPSSVAGLPHPAREFLSW